ncbi:hypothetical protein EP073_03120 [Geovibrio thiophilus]|uniref:Lipoprotein n=1 Tax=Geovibrio thiophilus TaxID=139438 RepID=A0A410JWL5_9BACT|nr:hypothetical protein [Geovibrio thiophilus]QAR32425.1 hypothetical protein EP073_03120 [Geovibrio thiophilus]
MKQFTVIFLFMFMLSGCDLFLSVRSDHVRVDIGDNVSDNKTDKNRYIFYVYIIGEKEPFAALDSASGSFLYASENGTETTLLTYSGSSRAASVEGGFGEAELVFADICENGILTEKDASEVRNGWESFAAACDFSGCAPEGFDIFAYAERNGFDAYCSAE